MRAKGEWLRYSTTTSFRGIKFDAYGIHGALPLLISILSEQLDGCCAYFVRQGFLKCQKYDL